jgi:hypothetical protein
MPKARILGKPLAHLQSTEETYDPNQGYSTTEDWEMQGGDRLSGKAAFYRSVGGSYRRRTSGPKAMLTATRSLTPVQNETVVERWELMTNQRELDIRESPRSIALSLLTYESDRKTRLGQVVEAVAKHNDGKAVDTTAFINADQLSLYNLMICGVTTYPVWQWVIRYTANISNTYNFFTEANSGVGTIYTTAQLGVPGGRLASTIGAIPEPDAVSGLLWGWLKIAIGETQVARYRIEASCEFHLAQWPTYLYV